MDQTIKTISSVVAALVGLVATDRRLGAKFYDWSQRLGRDVDAVIDELHRSDPIRPWTR